MESACALDLEVIWYFQLGLLHYVAWKEVVRHSIVWSWNTCWPP